jgi:hypothetical protein
MSAEGHMPLRRQTRAFVLLWCTLGLALLGGSLRTAFHALTAGGGSSAHVAALGVFEAASALLFLAPRTMRLGALGLIASFTVALLFHALRLELRWDLLIYAAAVYFVAVHGPVPRAPRPAMSQSAG